MSFVIAAFYHFFDFPDYAEARPALLSLLKHNQIIGSLLIAPEGINGTLSGTREGIDNVLAYLEKDIVKGPFTHKESVSGTQPFGRAKVRLKKETISLGESLPTKRRTGEYIEPKDWNTLITDPNTVIIDARNTYEVHLGTFERALDPGTRNFKQLPGFVRKHLDPKEHKHIATFCTGGIRCEKFSSWLLEQGFEHVYQLKGGILKYLEDVPATESKFSGECYVFDERVAVGHGLVPSATATMCKACGHALTPEDRTHPLYKENMFCPYCATRPPGFTLIELSIVLVIIGLIVGAILTGRDLIEQATLRKVISEKEKIQTAMNTFKSKYNCLAGDCINAESIFGSDASCPNTPANTIPKQATCNGDGDEAISPQCNGASSIAVAYEQFRMWQQLASAGLIPGSYSGVAKDGPGTQTEIPGVTSPLSPLGKNTVWVTQYLTAAQGSCGGVIYTLDYGNFLRLDTPSASVSPDTTMSSMTPLQAYDIDSKIDDGFPATGQMVQFLPAALPNCASSAAYTVSVTTPTCSPFFLHAF